MKHSFCAITKYYVVSTEVPLSKKILNVPSKHQEANFELAEYKEQKVKTSVEFCRFLISSMQ